MSSPTRRSASAEPREKSSSPPPLTRKSRNTKLFDRHKNASRSSSTDSEPYFECIEEEGLLPILKNIQYCLHKSLTNTSEDQLKSADRILKKDSNKALENALKTERSRMGSQIIKFLNGSSTTGVEEDIPKCPNFDQDTVACSEQEFEKVLKSIQRQYPRYSTKSEELLYFLTEVFQLLESLNLTDKQLIRILTNRFSDRLLSYFLTEIKRDSVVKVINRIAHRYIKTVNPSEEVDKYLNFTFRYKNLSDEITELRQTMALAHPRVDIDTLETMFLEKVLQLLPYKARHALLDDISKRQEMIKLGLVAHPYDDNELDSRIIFHCRGVEKSHQHPHQKREIKKIANKSDADVSLTPVKESSFNNDHLINILKEVKAIKLVTNKVTDLQDQVYALNVQNAEILASKNLSSMRPDNATNSPQKGRSNLLPSKRFRNYERKPYLQNPQPPKSPKASFSNDKNEVKIFAKDPRYSRFVEQIKQDQNFRYMGQKLKSDFYGAIPSLKQELIQIRSNKPKGKPIYNWEGNKYKISSDMQIKFPVLIKRGEQTPDLTAEALRHFAEVCYACGIRNCPGRHDLACAYNSKPDSWFLCPKCETGLHLAKDCLALVEN